MRLKKAGNPQESYNMNQKQKNSLGMGAMVGIVFFFTYYYGWFGMPLMVPSELGLAPGSVHRSSVT